MNHSHDTQFEYRLLEAIHWAYDRALSGAPGLDGAVALAAKYKGKNVDLADDATALIRWQIARAGTSGFISGLGGALSVPVALPANLAVVLFVQLRMVAAIAHLAGRDVTDERVRTQCFVCLCGQSAEDLLKKLGPQLGETLTKAAISQVSSALMKRIQKAVGGRLMKRAGTQGAARLSRLVPILGGVVGGTMDVMATKAIGQAAREMFLE